MSRARVVALTVGVYSGLSGLAVAWAAYRGRPWLLSYPEPWLALGSPWAQLSSLGAGLVLAMAVVLATRRWVHRFRWARDLHIGFREVLGALDSRTILALALTSGLGEELFFRGALQPTVGLTLSSVIFGVVHVGPDRRFVPWTLWAVAMGFLLGLMFQVTGSLVGPIVAHAAINYENLHFISGYDPRSENPDPGGAPRLVSKRERR